MVQGLYIHLPFCRTKCHYCDFVITTKNKPEDRQRFFKALASEIDFWREQKGRLHFETLYLGGGTPSMLEVDEMAALFERLKTAFSFSPGFEWTCEVNPEDASPKKLKAFRNLGVNRVSLGVQSFQNHLLTDMGRPHDAASTLRAINRIQETGFPNVSYDFILNLPGQTPEHVKVSLQQALSSNPGQLSVYDLDVHEATVYGLRRREKRLVLPDEAEHLAMVCLLEDMSASAGYAQYELTNFARPGFESRHNLIYWNNQEYLGLGPGAFSYLDGARSQFANSVNRYLEKCEKGDWPPDVKDVLTPEQIEMESLLTGLRLASGFDLNRLGLIRNRVECKLAYLKDGGLVEEKNERIFLTRQGKRIVESVLKELVDGAPSNSVME